MTRFTTRPTCVGLLIMAKTRGALRPRGCPAVVPMHLGAESRKISREALRQVALI